MARSNPEVYEDLCECAICSNQLVEPKALPCLHTFCLRCIEEYVKKSQETSGQKPLRLPCPICRENFDIPEKGCRELKTNFFLARVIEVQQQSAGRATATTPCGLCGTRAAVDQYCTECRKTLCGACAKTHKQQRATKTHQIKTVEDRTSRVAEVNSTRCSQHDEELEVYCKNCASVICNECFEQKHGDHDCEDIADMVDEERDELDDAVRIAEEEIGVEEQCAKEITARQAALLEHVSEKAKEICKATEETKRLADERQRRLLAELENIKLSSVKGLQQTTEDREFHRASLYGFRNHVQALRDNGTDVEVVRAIAAIKTRAKEFTTLTRNPMSLPSVNFPGLTSLEMEAEIRKMIPDLTTVETKAPMPKVGVAKPSPRPLPPNKPKPAPAPLAVGRMTLDDTKAVKYLKQPKEITTISGKTDVYALTMLNNDIYIARKQKPQDVEIYGGSDFRTRRTVAVKGLHDPRSMAACKLNNVVYISSSRDKAIFVVSSASVPGKPWPMDMEPEGVSVTSTGNVIVTYPQQRKLQAFSNKGVLQHTIILPAELKSPWCAVQYAADTYIISHGSSSDPVHRVCMVRADGSIIHQYGGQRGDGVNQLDNPCSVAVDPRGRVLVSDRANHRVHLLDSSLQHLKHLLTLQHGIAYPQCMWLDGDNGRLLVSSLRDVMLFQIY